MLSLCKRKVVYLFIFAPLKANGYCQKPIMACQHPLSKTVHVNQSNKRILDKNRSLVAIALTEHQLSRLSTMLLFESAGQDHHNTQTSQCKFRPLVGDSFSSRSLPICPLALSSLFTLSSNMRSFSLFLAKRVCLELMSCRYQQNWNLIRPLCQNKKRSLNCSFFLICLSHIYIIYAQLKLN